MVFMHLHNVHFVSTAMLLLFTLSLLLICHNIYSSAAPYDTWRERIHDECFDTRAIDINMGAALAFQLSNFYVIFTCSETKSNASK